MGAATMLRKILAIVLGMVIGSVVNMMFVQLSNSVYPLPEGVDPNDFEACKAYVEAHGLPTGVLLIVLIAHAGGRDELPIVRDAYTPTPVWSITVERTRKTKHDPHVTFRIKL